MAASHSPPSESIAALSGNIVLYDVPEAQVRLGGIGKTTLYSLMSAGELKVVHIGRRAFIPSDSIAAFITRKVA